MELTEDARDRDDAGNVLLVVDEEESARCMVPARIISSKVCSCCRTSAVVFVIFVAVPSSPSTDCTRGRAGGREGENKEVCKEEGGREGGGREGDEVKELAVALTGAPSCTFTLHHYVSRHSLEII